MSLIVTWLCGLGKVELSGECGDRDLSGFWLLKGNPSEMGVLYTDDWGSLEGVPRGDET